MLRLLLWIPVLAAGLAAAIWLVHPWPLALRWIEPTTTAYIQFRQAEARAEGTRLDIHHRPVPLDSIPEVLVRAVLVAEDDGFHLHRGVDWKALAEEVRYRGPLPPSPLSRSDRAEVLAAVQYVRANREAVRGRSTITQQLARNLYLSPERSMVRKAQELLIAWRLEWFLSKDRILELYLNSVELGPGVFGVAAASDVHFGRGVGELGLVEAASLAATLPHPRTSNPSLAPARMEWRRERILERMGHRQ